MTAPDTAVTYPRDTILTEEQVAEALHISVEKVKKADLPTIYFGRDRRFLWGSVLDFLKDREDRRE